MFREEQGSCKLACGGGVMVNLCEPARVLEKKPL